MAAHYFPGVKDGRAPVVVALVFLVGAMVAAFVVGTPPPSRSGDAATKEFLAAWERSRLATFVVHSDFVRTLPDGNQLKSTTTTVQDPPDNRLVIGFGSVSGRLDGKIVGCAAVPSGSGACVTGPPAPDYGSEVDDEIQGLADYVSGPRPLYSVLDFGNGFVGGFGSGTSHCFRLDLSIALPSPPYGDQALFCFDRASGAPSLTEIRRPEAVDQTIARQIVTTVQPSDLQVPDDRGPVVGVGPAPGG
jgi:hypothetical protein